MSFRVGPVTEELNALRTILFTPPLGSRLLMNEEMHLKLAGHLNTLGDLIAEHHALGWQEGMQIGDDCPICTKASYTPGMGGAA